MRPMHKFTWTRAAFAAALSLSLAPAAAQAPVATPSIITLVANAVAVEYAAADSDERHSHDVEFPRVAPGQEFADFETWLARNSENRIAARAFRMHLASHGVDDVLPVWQLVRTSSSWRGCGAQPFEIAPRDKWDNIVRTLQFVERNVVPSVGRVQAVSGYRNPGLNRCSAGASASAHQGFFALDLTPVNAGVTRGEMIRGVCAAHAREGKEFRAGLGFYNGRRFHVDTNGFRRWGANGRGATSPCGGYA